jgi:putative hydrolase of the HAD superfamily
MPNSVSSVQFARRIVITTVLFDLDDTLYDEVDYCQSGFRAVADFVADMPAAPPAERIFHCLCDLFAAGRRHDTFNAALDQLGIPCETEIVQELVHVYRNHQPNITLPPESTQVLEKLRPRYTLALLTDGYLPAQQLKVRALGIEQYFKRIIYTEQLGRRFWKPSPAGFFRLIEELDVKPQHMACIGDNQRKDFIAPNNLGCPTIQIIRQARIHTAELPRPDAAANHVIHKISQLPPLLEKL